MSHARSVTSGLMLRPALRDSSALGGRSRFCAMVPAIVASASFFSPNTIVHLPASPFGRLGAAARRQEV